MLFLVTLTSYRMGRVNALLAGGGGVRMMPEYLSFLREAAAP